MLKPYSTWRHYEDQTECAPMSLSSFKCPRCHSNLENEYSEFLCRSCNGALVNINELPNVSRINPKSISTLRKSQIDCPICGDTMRELLFRGIEIDICSDCNHVWLDFGEDHLRKNHKHEEAFDDDYTDNGILFAETSIFIEEMIRSSEECPQTSCFFSDVYDFFD